MSQYLSIRYVYAYWHFPKFVKCFNNIVGVSDVGGV